ncbi:Protein of unknown function [Pelagirhabdus alkalitolerans]|uniref:DUF2642 domain-containing protein n=1 Tax=Pelagirhabdus alkalitolerans TaxID=1612202 RepID=A0A1G6IKT9_9BACI|nr:YuzF family protein [Pelagirhabdus alkalitolerans]SDC07061.1 Protein of unknown function [Pelagirhabdus alkalitolerans]
MEKNYPSFIHLIDSYLYETLKQLNQKEVIVQTTKGTVSGYLKKVMPDHIVVYSGGSDFHIRIQQIVWVIPKR